MYKYLNIGNVYEFNNSSVTLPYSRISINQSPSDEYALFWGEDNKVIVTSIPIDKWFLDDYRSMMNYKDVVCWLPPSKTGSISRDVMIELDDLQILLSRDKKININVWGATSQVDELVDSLRLNDFNVQANFRDSKYDWLSAYLDSKLGAKLILSEINQTLFDLSKTNLVTNNFYEIKSAILNFLSTKHQKVFKVNHSHGGHGVIYINSNNRHGDLISSIEQLLQLQFHGQKPLMLIEEFIGEEGTNLLFSIDINIEKKSEISVKPPSLMYIDEEGKYIGLEIGKSVLSDTITSLLQKVAYSIAKHLVDLNYTGWFDIDLIQTKTSQLYVTEINARRTGGTQPICFAEQKFGMYWMEKIAIVCIDKFFLKSSYTKYTDVRDLLHTFNSQLPETAGIVLFNSRGITYPNPYISCGIYASDICAARELYQEITNIVGA